MLFTVLKFLNIFNEILRFIYCVEISQCFPQSSVLFIVLKFLNIFNDILRFIFCVETDGTPIFSTLWDDWSEYDPAYEARMRKAFQGEAGKFGANATTSRTMAGV